MCVPAGRWPSPACPLEDRGKGGLCQVGPLSSTICRIWCYAKTPRGVFILLVPSTLFWGFYRSLQSRCGVQEKHQLKRVIYRGEERAPGPVGFSEA